MPIRLSNTLITLLNIILYLITFFIGMRVILRFFSANPQTPMVAWIYNISGSLIYPFRGIFPDLSSQVGMLDLVAITALIGYMILGYLVTWLISRFAIAATEVDQDIAHYHDIDSDLEEDPPRHRRYSR